MKESLAQYMELDFALRSNMKVFILIQQFSTSTDIDRTAMFDLSSVVLFFMPSLFKFIKLFHPVVS